jgi:CRP-like cAMP-binding protein
MSTPIQNPFVDKLSGSAHAAWQESFFARLPVRAGMALLESAVEIEAQAGHVIRRQQLTAPANPMLVTYGLVRVYVSSPQGREVTVRHTRHGVLTGLAGALAGGTRHGVQAVSDCGLLILQASVLRQLAQTDVNVAWLLCQELKDTVFAITDHLASSVFQPVTARVAMALLELARDEDGLMTVDANQQQIADSVGSVREVVARSLKQLRAAGLIDRQGTVTVVLDPAALRRLAAFDAAGSET